MLHCEVCGTAVGDLEVAQYCLDCGLYVCAVCWRPAQRTCVQCVDPGRGTVDRGSWVLRVRRADRRLREVIRDAGESTPVRGASTTADRDFVRACMRLKAESAVNSGRLAVARLSMARSRDRLLAVRLERNGVQAKTALGVGSTEMHPVSDSVTFTSAERPRLSAWPVTVAAAAAVAVAVVMLPQLIGGGGLREGTLSGFIPESSALSSPSLRITSSSPPSTSDESEPYPDPSPILIVTFDEVTMNSGLGEGWYVPGEGDMPSVAPVPNAVNRSARLFATAGSVTESCIAMPARLDQLSLTVDLMLGSGIELASVTLASPTWTLTAAFGGEHSTLKDDGSVAVAELGGMAPGEWYRSTITLTPTAKWELAPVASGAVPQSVSIERPTWAGTVDRLCIAAKGATGSAAHFDNIAITEGRTDS